jgi:hypothetical protein
MKSRIILVGSLVISAVLFFLVFTQGLMFVNNYLGLYNVTTFRFRLGEVVFVLFVFLLLFLFPILYGRTLYIRSRQGKPRVPAKKRALIIAAAAAGCLGVLVIVLLHTGFFTIITDFLYYCGIYGTGVTLGILAVEVILAVMVLIPALLLLLRLRPQKGNSNAEA